MKNKIIFISLSSLFLAVLNVWTDDLSEALQPLTERTLLEESTAVKQAAVKASSDTDYSMEFRPSYSENESELALRFYFPNRWTRGALRNQLNLVGQSEELRVATLEWKELIEVYRTFCTYRMLNKQIALLNAEADILAPYLKQADISVQQHQLATIDRAKLYGQYLDLLNSLEKIEVKHLAIQTQLHQIFGASADLNDLAKKAIIEQPTRLELDSLIQDALENRADYRQLDVEAQSLKEATKIARSKGGFHFKYIQPEYKIDQTGNGEDSWNISAAFTLPWGNRNPDLAVYRKQQTLTESEMALQRRIIKEHIQSLLAALEKFTKQIEKHQRLTTPLLEQLQSDLKQFDGLPLDKLRDQMIIREQLLKSAIQNINMEYERNCIIIDLIEELGSSN
ncbi:MAG: hypothetical protein PF692_14660 [Kiritimatiellae bacterium]|jgi:hypothetical protein|nr:hypothetical protein [Kiritimatiellia bacterium]